MWGRTGRKKEWISSPNFQGKEAQVCIRVAVWSWFCYIISLTQVPHLYTGCIIQLSWLFNELISYRLNGWKNLPPFQETQEPQLQSPCREDPLEKKMATHSSILAWKIPWAEEPGGLQSMGLQSRTWLSNQAPISYRISKVSLVGNLISCGISMHWFYISSHLYSITFSFPAKLYYYNFKLFFINFLNNFCY